MRRDTLRTLGACVCAALFGLAGSAHAADGVIEINHASILAAGGYPFTIAASGSYVLTGNLTPAGGSGAIIVTAPDVTLDLNGFQILGAGGAAEGIFSDVPAQGLTVRNGSVIGFGQGIRIETSAASKILQVTVRNNDGTGISTRGDCLIVESIISGNAGDGVFLAANSSKVENSVIENNGRYGLLLDATANAVVVSNLIRSNDDGGIVVLGGDMVIQENVISSNGSFGISDFLGGPAPVPPMGFERVTIRGNTIRANLGPGVTLKMPALISDNIVSINTGSGVVCGAACTLRGNVIDSNNTSALAGSGGATVAAGSTVNDNSISFNTGFGLTLPVTSGYRQNTLNANGPLDVVAVPPGPHPTSGAANLCSGVPGPAPTCP